MKKYIKANSNDAEYSIKKEFANRIPLDELFDYIRSITGIPDIQFETKISDGTVFPDVFFISNDISDKIGWLDTIFSRVRIISYNRTINIGKNLYERQGSTQEFKANSTGDYKYWVRRGIEYIAHIQPNSSPTIGFMTAQYSDKYGWEFVLDKAK